MRRNPADIVTARALRHGLESGSSCDTVIGELVSLARGDRRPLETALARVERGLADRSSLVGERARDALEGALGLVATDRGGARTVTRVGGAARA